MQTNGVGYEVPLSSKALADHHLKNTGISRKGETVLLARARGLAPVGVPLPDNILDLEAPTFLEARLVWDRAARHYSWHLVVDDGTKPAPAPTGDLTAAVDLGEIHPAAVTDGQETVIITCRALRANQQYTAKRLAVIRAKQACKRKGSRSWRRLQRRKSRFLAKQRRRASDLEHKASRAVVTWSKERKVTTLVIGDVRDVAVGKRLKTKSQQKIGLWSHGRQRAYITYKAEAAGISVVLVDEAYTSQTCPVCLNCTKPKGRVYRCPVCGFVGHRDGLGAANILSQHYTGEAGHVLPPPPKYRYPFGVLRSRPDTADLAWGPTAKASPSQEAAEL